MQVGWGLRVLPASVLGEHSPEGAKASFQARGRGEAGVWRCSLRDGGQSGAPAQVKCVGTVPGASKWVCLGVSHGVGFHSSATLWWVSAWHWKRQKEGLCHQSNRSLLCQQKRSKTGPGPCRCQEEEGRGEREARHRGLSDNDHE